MSIFGNLWEILAFYVNFGNLWQLMATFSGSLGHRTFDNFWHLLATYGTLCKFFETLGNNSFVWKL